MTDPQNMDIYGYKYAGVHESAVWYLAMKLSVNGVCHIYIVCRNQGFVLGVEGTE